MKIEVFQGVQFLRFFAALLVVITHSTGAVAERMLNLGPGKYWVTGLSGVDIFFVISGFVMALSSGSLIDKADAYKTFLIRRIIRIVPLYWIATSAKIAAVIVFSQYALHSKLDIPYLLASYFFIPALNADGEILPILTVGWTLSFEMFFYIVFAIALAFRIQPLRFVAFIFSTLIIIGLFRLESWSPPFQTFTNTLILEFLFGMVIAYLYKKIKNVPPLISLALIISGFSLLFYPEIMPLKQRVFSWGLAAFLLVSGFVFSEVWLGKSIPKILTLLGDSSYSLYLFHPFVLPLIVVIFVKIGITNSALTVTTCVLISLISGHIIHKLLEKPLTNYLNSKIKSIASRKPHISPISKD